MLASAQVGALPFFLLAQASFTLAAEPPASAAVILYVTPARASGIDSRALADAVGIYTRDLGFTVETVQDAGVGDTPAAVERVTAIRRVRGARLAFWCVSAADDRTVTLLSVDAQGSVHSDLVAAHGSQGPDLYRALALKLRAILIPSSDRADSDRAALLARPARPAAAVARQPLPAATAAPSALSSTPRWGLALEYCLWLAPGSASPRQGLGLEVNASPASSPALEIYASGRLARAAQRTVTSGAISLSDLPLRLGARWIESRRSLALALGLFASVHILSASATSATGAKADTATAAGGGGLEALLRIPPSGRLAWELSAWAEGVASRTHFLVGGNRAIETGRYAFGLAIAVALATR